MTPAALSTILIRFIALGVFVYGIVLIARGVITHSEGKRVYSAIALVFGDAPPEAFRAPLSKVTAILYAAGGATVLAGSILYAISRQLGRLIAQGV